jgi:polysaccharide export outer membrane protein
LKLQRWAIRIALVSQIALAVPTLPRGQSAQKLNKAVATESANGKENATSVAKTDTSYLIGPEDVLNISVWKEEEVSRTVPVRPDGKISLPLLKDMQAAGLTPMQLADMITERLKKFMAQPQVTVIVTQVNSQRIFVIGQIARPGTYPLLPGMTILQAISSAGGLAQFANQKKIFLLRSEDGTQRKSLFNYKDVLEGRKSEQNLLLKAGDTIVVP